MGQYSNILQNYEYSSNTDNKVMNVAPPERSNPQLETCCVNVPTENDNKIHTPPRWKKFSMRLRFPVLLNCIIFVTVSILLLLLEIGWIPHTKLGFYCKDPYISHIYKGETINTTVLLIGSIFGPLILITLLEALRETSFRRIHISNVWFYYKEHLIGIIIVLAIIELTKVIAGEHRPHFLDTCQPDANFVCRPGEFIEEYSCTNTLFSRYFLTDSSKSFPSGHATVSTFAAFFSAYLVFKRLPTVRTGRLLRPLLIVSCLTWSIVCSFTRITDQRHHWWDVLAGVFLGCCGAVYSIKMTERNLRKIVPPKMSVSTTTLLDVKNKQATSVIL